MTATGDAIATVVRSETQPRSSSAGGARCARKILGAPTVGSSTAMAKACSGRCRAMTMRLPTRTPTVCPSRSARHASRHARRSFISGARDGGGPRWRPRDDDGRRLAPTSIASKTLHELFVGNLPMDATQENLMEFLNAAMRERRNASRPGQRGRHGAARASKAFMVCRTPEEDRRAPQRHPVPRPDAQGRAPNFPGPRENTASWQALTARSPRARCRRSRRRAPPSGAVPMMMRAWSTRRPAGCAALHREHPRGHAARHAPRVPRGRDARGRHDRGARQSRDAMSRQPIGPIAEFRSVDEATRALDMDGIPFLGQAPAHAAPRASPASTIPHHGGSTRSRRRRAAAAAAARLARSGALGPCRRAAATRAAGRRRRADVAHRADDQRADDRREGGSTTTMRDLRRGRRRCRGRRGVDVVIPRPVSSRPSSSATR